MPLNRPKQGEVWRVRLDPGEGAEIGKTRPCVVLSSANVGRLPLHIIVPVTDWKTTFETYSWMTYLDPDRINGLVKPSGADSFQVRSVSVLRFIEKVGQVTVERLSTIEAATRLCIEVL